MLGLVFSTATCHPVLSLSQGFWSGRDRGQLFPLPQQSPVCSTLETLLLLPDRHCYSMNLPGSPRNTLSPAKASMKPKFQLTAGCQHRITLSTFEVFILRGILRKLSKALLFLSCQSTHRLPCRYKAIAIRNWQLDGSLGWLRHMETGAKEDDRHL